MAGDLQLPPGYEDAKAVQGLTLPPGYEDAKPAAASASPSTTPATPQPIPTAVNRMASRRNAQAQPTVTPAMRSAAAAPVITSAENALPAAGMVAGGVLGSVEPGAGNIAGAALGGMAGEQARRLIQGKPTTNKEAAIQTAGAGAQGATGEMGGQIIGKGIEVAAPYVSKSIETLSDLPPARKTTWFAPHTETPGYDYAEAPPSVIPDAAPTPPTPASAPVAGPPPVSPLSNRQIGSRIEQGVKEAAGTTPGQPIYPRAARGTVGAQTVGEQPNIEIAGPRIQTPSRNETLTEAMKNRVPGSNPLEAKMPLEEQPISPARTPAQPAEETVHPMDRQFIHVNGSRLLEQIADKPGLRDPLLDLEGNQLREVLRKSGEDMTQIQSVGKSAGKAARGGTISDPTNLTRQEAFDRLLDKGYTPEQILKEAGQRSKPAATRVPFGPPRTTNATK